ncbi:hypothetical protein SLE2022_075950 [Rubroshorea leprosula]
MTFLPASDHFTRTTTLSSHSTSDPLSKALRFKNPTPSSSLVESQKNYSTVVYKVEPLPLSWLLSPRLSSAMLNSTKESSSLLASVYRYNLFERATLLPSGPSPMTDTTVVRTVQNLPFSLFPVRIQNFAPSSTNLHVLASRARNFPPPPKVHHASISKI